MIISFCLVTLKFDLGVILSGEIRCWSLLGVNKLKWKRRRENEIVISVSLWITEDIISSLITRSFYLYGMASKSSLTDLT